MHGLFLEQIIRPGILEFFLLRELEQLQSLYLLHQAIHHLRMGISLGGAL